MKIQKKAIVFAIAALVVFSSLGVSVQPVQAATCASYHTVVRGQTLSSIGSYYGVAWKSLAEANNLSYPYTIYSGQQLCIPGGVGGAYTYYPVTNYYPTAASWNFRVIGVDGDDTVTIETINFPDNTWFDVEIGCPSCGLDWVSLADLDTDEGGTFKKVFIIPDELSGYNQLIIRLTQVKKNKEVPVEHAFRIVTPY